VLVVSGQKAVQEGETVSKGMLLIRGSQAGTNGSEQAVKANGQVLARVWREEFSTVPLNQTLRQRTGQVSECRFLNLGGKEIIIKGKGSSPYPVYDQQVTKREVLGRISSLTVEIISIRYYEVVEETRSYTWDQAQKLAEEQVTQAVESKLPANARVTDRKMERISGDNPDEVKVRILVETLEDIGVFAAN
jgi:similar to stage IV sporulation protein